MTPTGPRTFTPSRLNTALSLALLSVCSLPLANAQEQNEQQSVERLEVRGSRLDKASTATGLPLTLRKTPQSVSIIGSEFIDSFALESIADIMTFAPGLQAQRAETDRYFFRARGNDITNFQFDGVPVNYNSFFNDAVTDTIIFERVEVVRGATGLLTGAGEPSAAINLIRKRPKAEGGGYINARLGSWNQRRLELDHSLSLSEDGAVNARVAGAYEQGDSYVDLAEKDDLQLYGVITADLSTQTRLTVGLDHSRRNPKGSTWGALPLFYADGSPADDLPVSTTTAANWTKWERDGTNAFAAIEHAFDNGWDVHAELERREGEMDGHLLYVFGLPDKETGLGMGTSPLIYQSKREQDALRVMASGPFSALGREHNLTAGLLYSQQDISSDSFSALEAVPVGNFLEWDGSAAKPPFTEEPSSSGSETITQKGGYLAAQFNLHDQFNLILGSRLSDYEVEGATGNYEHGSVTTPYAGLVYDLTDMISAYVSYTEIFQPQDAKDINSRRLDPVEGSNAEIGVKGDFFGQALTASFALFKVEKDNVAILDPNFTEPLPDGSFPYIAVKGARNKGYELEVNGNPNDQLDLYFSFTHSESEQANGSPFKTYLPEDMIRLSGLYRISDQIKVGANINWQSEMVNPGVGPNGESARQDAYTLVNLMASYDISEQLQAQINLNNALDKKYYSSIDFYNQGFWGPERNLQVSLRYSW
ncbi:TonB-dependent siderophore receptor [Lacimicrobium alkaliphilum]|uniref:TonB-dependent siderophore receptor n=1 Tax=Lacimicrobium alkaliphilum TaxID=1526571 RepID=UPI0009E8D155|nr:TonB-dependent siderophore receptor [Lacimicrobium alkaliphilum]